jgi:CRP-like cAMP-binding protein
MRAGRSVAGASRIETLRVARELATCSDRYLEGLLPYFDEVSLPAGTRVAREGDRCTAFAVVMNGRLQANAGCARTRTLIAGDSFGWNAMMERASNEETVIVAADARLLVMSHAQFRAVKVVADPSRSGSSPAVL